MSKWIEETQSWAFEPGENAPAIAWYNPGPA